MTARGPGTSTATVITWAQGILGVLLIGAVDYYSGVELRVYPLYYAPIALLAWRAGRAGAVVAAALSGAMWVVSNRLAGLTFSEAGLWVANGAMQMASFAIVGLLIARLHGALDRERDLSRTDPLTDLLNRRAFYEEATRMLALCRRMERPVTLAYVDLDHFKAVNDSLGHQAGDEVLRAVSAELRTVLRPSDISARLGGDEFVVLYPGLGPAEAPAALERLREALAARLAGGTSRVTASVGGISCANAPADAATLIEAADARMYAAKSAGRDQVALALLDQPAVRAPFPRMSGERSRP